MSRVLPPKAHPCGSCPYRRDVPSGLWDEEEYVKLPSYDGEIGDQLMAGAMGVFMCHQQDGHACAGWVGCHDMENTGAFRIACANGAIEEDDAEAWLDYECAVPLFASGREAADHGLARVESPPPEAVRVARRLRRKLQRETS